MSRYLSIGQAAKVIGVSPSTLRRWERAGRLCPHRTKGGHRRYTLEMLGASRSGCGSSNGDRKTVAYARVSSSDQNSDLQRQIELLERYCAAKGWAYEVISDRGSGLNYHKKGLRRLIEMVLYDQVERLVLVHKDRLLRFGAELIFTLCELKNVEVVIINQGRQASFEEELVQDVLEIITVFSARLYGSRSHKNKKLIEKMKEAADAACAPR